jgi:transposase-like protein
MRTDDFYLTEEPDLGWAFTEFPRAQRKKIWSANPLERLNREIQRRPDVVGVFPKPEALARLPGAILAEHHDVGTSKTNAATSPKPP